MLLAAALASSTCGSSSIAVTSPTTPKCQVSATNSLASAPSDGATATIAVDTTRDCTWTASSAAAWIVITSQAEGQGAGNVSYRVSANADPSPRHGMIDVNGTQVAVAQDAAPCHFSVALPNGAVPAGGGPIALAVTASAAACTWTATSSVAWITTAMQPAAGNGTATFTVAANTGTSARSGVVTVAGQTITITQSAPDQPPPPPPPPPAGPCTDTLSATTQTIGPAGGPQSVGVNAPAGCAWTAAANVDWITVTPPASGTGNGQLAYSVAANPGAARTGTLTIAGVTLTVTQASAACSVMLAPPDQSIPALGGTGSVAVNARGDCSWNAVSSADWLQISSGASGMGNGTVGFTVAINLGPARTATVTVAGQTVTVTQAAVLQLCTFVVSPLMITADSHRDTEHVDVAAGVGCPWTAVSNADWLTLPPPAAGNGNGSVTINVDRNMGAPRSGTVTIAGQVVTVQQSSDEEK
jgi:hypothetical protein